MLTRSIAQKYFGAADPLGKTLALAERTPLKVTGVIEDLSDDTPLQFSLVTSLPPQAENWYRNAFYTYALMRPGANADDIRKDSNDVGTHPHSLVRAETRRLYKYHTVIIIAV